MTSSDCGQASEVSGRRWGRRADGHGDEDAV